MTQETWAEWLRNRLDERAWKQSDLVRESKSHIKADRVSKWLNGRERPSYKLAIITANTLGIPHDVALSAAGYADQLPDAKREASTPLRIFVEKPLSDFDELELLDELRRRATLRERAEMSDVGATVTELVIPQESDLRGAANRDAEFDPDAHTDI